ncbi:MAG: PfkB family carbohydrate kinase [bacterium]|nr:PfkB family carbohydrate kinase [bacterium]
MNLISIIVSGGLNTDIIVTGIKKFPSAGEHVYGKELTFGPGGKSRNIANMSAVLMGRDRVAMIGKTVKDQYGLWKIPIEPLEKAGVNIEFVQILEFEKVKKLPAFAIIPVDISGNNMIYVLPGISDDFSTTDIDLADQLFIHAKNNKGIFISSLEIPLGTAVYAFKKANKYGLKIVLDPGGIQKGMNIDSLFENEIYLIKPNEHEAKLLTGINVTDFSSAKEAALCLFSKKVKNVFITCGKQGAYLFTNKKEIHIPIPIFDNFHIQDETGCGDQTTAAFCTFLQEGKNIEEAAHLAIIAGTLQFQRIGIQPVKKDEILKIYESQN